MKEHLVGFHKAPRLLRLQTTDKPPEGLSPGPQIPSSSERPPTPLASGSGFITTTANTPPLTFPMSPEGPPLPPSPLLGDLSSSPGTQQPPDSPYPGPTPSRKAYVSDDDDNPFATRSTARRPGTISASFNDSSFEDNQVRDLLTPIRPLFVSVESPDFDDIYEHVPKMPNRGGPPSDNRESAPDNDGALPSPSPRRLRSQAASSFGDMSSRRSQTAATSQVYGLHHDNDNNADPAGINDGSTEHTDDDGSQDLKADPMTKMLESAGLFVVPVDDEIHVLACIACQKGIKPSNALSHAKSKPHKLRISKQRQAEITAWIKNAGKMADHTRDLPKVHPQGEKPVEGLPVFKGFSCTECAYCCRKTRMHDSHWSKHHRNHGSPAAMNRDDADVQTYFKNTPKYFSVNPVLKGTTARSIIRLYVNQHSKDVASFLSDTILPPISPLEVPPLLQETQWHSHLRRFLHSKKKIRDLRRLVRLPRGKKAQKDPLGDTLRAAIVLYMRNIRKKGLDSPLDVRGILTSAPT